MAGVNLLKNVIENSAKFARTLGSSKIETEHLLFGVLSSKGTFAEKLLLSVGIDETSYKKVIFSYLKNKEIQQISQVSYSKTVSEIFAKTNDFSQKNASKQQEIEFILHLILKNSNFKATKILVAAFKIDVQKMILKLEKYLNLDSQKALIQNTKQSKKILELPDELKNLGYDLTKKIKEKPMNKIIGRDEETERVIEILCRKTKNNPVLVGEPGVGKSSVVEGLAQRINEGNVPEILSEKIIFALDLASLMAGTKFRGSMEEKLKSAISAIQENEQIIVFIDEIHMLAEAGAKEGEISITDILKPYLARGELHVVGATTLDEYKKYIEKDPALERRFQPVNVDEPSAEDAISILKGIRSSFENFHNVKISDEAIELAVNLSIRYITNRFLPDKAIDLIDEACSKVRVGSSAMPKEVRELNVKIAELDRQKEICRQNQDFISANEINEQKKELNARIEEIKSSLYAKTGNSFGEISADNIREVVSSWTKIPVNKLSSSEKEKLLNLENIIGDRVIGQPDAVSVVSNAIRRSRADINDPNRPIGSFLFLGPTGVGKTELTKAIADVLFDSEDSIIRFDMSEFMESHSISRLIGAPPGYVGHEDGGELTEAVRKKPYSIVLFDEIEKAHPDIFNIMLQIFDEGRLTDSAGKLVNFKNTLIILTSNNGVQDLIARRKFEKANPNEAKVSTDEFLMDKLRDKFKPELLNRIDSVVIFDTLSKESLLKISGLMIKSLMKNMERSRKISLQVTDEARVLICDKGYDEAYGARPLKRVIDKEVRDPLANMIVSGELANNSAVRVDAENGKFKFEVLC